jgi:hypothetical protein
MPVCCSAGGIEPKSAVDPEKKARQCGGQKFREEALRQRSAMFVFGDSSDPAKVV